MLFYSWCDTSSNAIVSFIKAKVHVFKTKLNSICMYVLKLFWFNTEIQSLYSKYVVDDKNVYD